MPTPFSAPIGCSAAMASGAGLATDALPGEERAAKAVLLLDAIRNTPSIVGKQALAARAGWSAGFCSAGAVALERRATARALVEVGRNLKQAQIRGLVRLSRKPDGTLLAGHRADAVVVVGAPVEVKPAADGTHRTALEVLGLATAPVAVAGQRRVLSFLKHEATVSTALRGITRRLDDLLASASRRVSVTGDGSGYLPLQGMDLRGAPLPDELMRGVLQDVNLAGEDLSGHRLRDGCFRRVDLGSSTLPPDLQDAQFIGCDLRGARVRSGADAAGGDSAQAGVDAPQAWPDLSKARLRGAVLDFAPVVEEHSDMTCVAGLIDATTPDAERSLLRSIHTIVDPRVKRDAMERLLTAAHRVHAALRPACPALLDTVFGEYGSGMPQARIRFAASLAAVLFDPVYSGGEERTGIAWARSELASELAERARFYHGNTAALVTGALHQAAFPVRMRELALHLNPDLAWSIPARP